MDSSITRQKIAPLSSREISILKKRAEDIQETAKAKGNVALSSSELKDEMMHAEDHFDLGCWLYFYSRKVGLEGAEGLTARIDCLKRLIKAGFSNPGYSFFTVFDFGERDYDTIFEMGDGDLVKQAIVNAMEKDPQNQFKAYCKEMGWLQKAA